MAKKSHNYYYQIKGELAVTQLPWCDFVVWTPHGTSVLRIERDKNLWKQMYCKLKAFYHEYLLPELTDSVFHNGQSIRRFQFST